MASEARDDVNLDDGRDLSWPGCALIVGPLVSFQIFSEVDSGIKIP
jgi:hypothetical protein